MRHCRSAGWFERGTRESYTIAGIQFFLCVAYEVDTVLVLARNGCGPFRPQAHSALNHSAEFRNVERSICNEFEATDLIMCYECAPAALFACARSLMI